MSAAKSIYLYNIAGIAIFLLSCHNNESKNFFLPFFIHGISLHWIRNKSTTKGKKKKDSETFIKAQLLVTLIEKTASNCLQNCHWHVKLNVKYLFNIRLFLDDAEEIYCVVVEMIVWKMESSTTQSSPLLRKRNVTSYSYLLSDTYWFTVSAIILLRISINVVLG